MRVRLQSSTPLGNCIRSNSVCGLLLPPGVGHYDDTHTWISQGGSREIATDTEVHHLTECNLFDPPSPLLFPPSPHRHWRADCKSLGLRTLAAPIQPGEVHSIFPFLQSNHAGYSLRRDDSQVHDNELPGRLWSRLSILSFFYSGSFNTRRVALEPLTLVGISLEKDIGKYQKALPIPYRRHKTQEDSEVPGYFLSAQSHCQNALRTLGCGPNPCVQLAVCGCHRCGDSDVGVLKPRRETLISIRTGYELDDCW